MNFPRIQYGLLTRPVHPVYSTLQKFALGYRHSMYLAASHQQTRKMRSGEELLHKWDAHHGRHQYQSLSLQRHNKHSNLWQNMILLSAAVLVYLAYLQLYATAAETATSDYPYLTSPDVFPSRTYATDLYGLSFANFFFQQMPLELEVGMMRSTKPMPSSRVSTSPRRRCLSPVTSAGHVWATLPQYPG